MCAYPNITIHAQNNVYFPSTMSGLNGPNLSSSSDNSAATAGAGNGEEDSVAQFAVL